MQNVLRFIRAVKDLPGVTRRFIISQLLLLGWVVFQLLIPFMIRTLIDEGINAGNLEVVASTALWMVLFAFISAVLLSIAAGYSVGFAVESAHGLRVVVYRKVQNLSFGNLDRFQTSDVLVRLTNDVNIIKQMVMMGNFYLFRAPFMLIGAVVLVFIASRAFFPIIVAVLIITGFLLYVYARYAEPLFRVVQVKVDLLNRILQENLAGVRVVKAFIRAEHEMKRYDERNLVLKKISIKPARLMAFLEPGVYLTFNLATAAALYFGGVSMVQGAGISTGDIVTFNDYLYLVIAPMVMVIIILPMLARGEVSMNRLFQVLDAEADVKEKADAQVLGEIKGRVVFENVTMSYLDDNGKPNPTPILKNINLTAEPGQTVAILGATGSGKSTLVNLIPRFYDVTAGRVTIDGIDVRDVKLEDLRQKVSIALQQAILFSGNVQDNIRYGRPEATQAEIEEVAKAADAHAFVSSHVDGYDRRVAREGANFSGGQRQRISLARALAVKPKILILDDTTSAVDVATETRIQEALAKIAKGVTTFIVAQRISTTIIADNIILLESGEIVAQGKHKELLSTSPLYREIYESQLGKLEE